MLNCIKCELKKISYYPLLLLVIVSMELLFLVAIGYQNNNGVGLTVAELFLAQKQTLLSNVDMNRYSIWYGSLSRWQTLIMPMLLGINYSFLSSYERKSNAVRFMLIREGKCTYIFSKIISGAIWGGAVFTLSYLFFCGIVYAKFPSVQEYGMTFDELYGTTEIYAVYTRILKSFFYGVFVMVIPIIVSSVFKDRYVLICVPVMLKFSLDQLLMKTMVIGIENENQFLIKMASDLSLESIINGQTISWYSVGTMIILYILAYFMMTKFTTMGDTYGFE